MQQIVLGVFQEVAFRVSDVSGATECRVNFRTSRSWCQCTQTLTLWNRNYSSWVEAKFLCSFSVFPIVVGTYLERSRRIGCTSLKYVGICENNIIVEQNFFGVLFMESKTRSKSMSSFWIRKRSDIDIMASILSEANKGTKKTHIMYKCNLSHKQLQVYMQLLLDMEFLMTPQKKDNQKFDYFRTTPKGYEFINAYCTLKGLVT